MKIHQLFDDATSTYTYVLVDTATGEAAIVDPVRERSERDLAFLHEHQLTLSWIAETHVHADHITGAGTLRQQTGATIVVGEDAAVPCADRQLQDGELLTLGTHEIQVLHTPGHTPGCISLFIDDPVTPVVLTGDALLIDGCGRTDFQAGSSRTLYRSIHSKLWTLPNRTVVYPGHDYRNRKSCTIGLQKEINPRLNTSISLEKFQTIMGNLDLPRPKRIMESLPANYACGLLERTSGSSANTGTHGSQVRSSSTC